MPPEIETNIESTATNLELIRELVGEPVHIISGYRCPEHNKQIGGARSSEHLTGRAADLKIIGWNGQRLRGFFEGLIALEELPEGGLGSYDKHPEILHYDWRGTRARWHYDVR
jgi:uncharacterized protein YcbK (DUF882 family)